MEQTHKRFDMCGFNCHGARDIPAEEVANVVVRFVSDRVTESLKFGIGEVRVINHDGLNQEVEWRKVEGKVMKGGPPGFPRGHRAPVCYSNHNTRIRALAMQRP